MVKHISANKDNETNFNMCCSPVCGTCLEAKLWHFITQGKENYLKWIVTC